MTKSLLLTMIFMINTFAFGEYQIEGKITFIGTITEGSCLQKAPQKITKQHRLQHANELFDDCDLNTGLNGIKFPKASIKRFIPATEKETKPDPFIELQLSNILDHSNSSNQHPISKRDKKTDNTPLIYIAEYK